MGTTTVRWLEGGVFIGTDSTNHSVVLSTTAEGVGVKPSEMLLVALSACTAVDVVDILAKKKMPLTKLEIRATGENQQSPPWPYTKIHLLYRLKGEGLTDKAIRQAIELSESRYCSVAATIRGVAEITWEYELID